jgi:hypothetical protein
MGARLHDSDMTDVLQALLTPLIAIITTYIAYQQYRIRRDERSLALYDRRLALFKNAIAPIDQVHAGHRMTTAEALSLSSSVAEAQFLFGEEVQAVLAPLFSAVYEYAVESESRNDDQLLNIARVDAALLVEAFRTPLLRVMSPYLRPAGSPQTSKPRLTVAQVEALLAQCIPPEVTQTDDGRDIPF